MACGGFVVAACDVVGPIYADRPGGEITVWNECGQELLVAISGVARPSKEAPNSDLRPIAVGEYARTGDLDSSGTFHVLAVGPSGDEQYWAVSFTEQDPHPVLRIEGSECPD